jgi:hypothetical protein
MPFEAAMFELVPISALWVYAPQAELNIIGERRNHEAQTSLVALINGNVLPWPLRLEILKAANVDGGFFYL